MPQARRFQPEPHRRRPQRSLRTVFLAALISLGHLHPLPASLMTDMAPAGDRTSRDGCTHAGNPACRPETAAALHLRNGQAALERRDFHTALAELRQAVEMDPHRPAAREGFAAAALALGRDAEARDVLLQGLALHPDRAGLHEALGDLEERAHRLEAAMTAWRRAFALSPTPALQEKIDRGAREAGVARGQVAAAGSHFLVFHDGDVDGALAGEVLAELEARHADLSLRLSHVPEQPISVVLYAGRQFHEVTGADAWVGGLYDGKIRVPLGGLRGLGPDARRLLAHELTHALVHSKTRGNCPRWLQEGLAQMVEGRVLLRAERAHLARQLRLGDGQPGSSLPFSYPLALALTRELEEGWGFDGLVHLLDRLGAGDSADEALRRVTGESAADFFQRWAQRLLAEIPA